MVYNRCVGKQRKRRSNNSNGQRRAGAPSSKVADARQRANVQAGRKRSKDAAERAQQRAEERAAAEQTARTAARQRAIERSVAEAERSAAAAQREALQAASPLPGGQRLPSGWTERCPDAPTDTNPAACAAHREELLAWISEGLDAVHEADIIDNDEPDYEACWEGRTVRVHRRAVTAASAVLGITERVMEDRGLRFAQPARSEVGLSPEGMRRVLMCVCDHDACGQTVPKLFEARCPSTNAILEYPGVEHGYICPAEACYAEMSRRGFDSTTDQHNAAWKKVAPVVVTRLGLEGDPDKDKPIYAPDIVRDNDGNLLAVRPRRPHRKTRRPSVEEAIDHLEARPEGVSVKAFAATFGIGDATARRVIDEINPEFVYLRSPRRCIRRSGDTSRYVFAVTSDRDEIDRAFEDWCRPGRNYDIDCVAHRPTGLILSSGLRCVW